MKRFVKKSAIPDSKVFVIKKLCAPYFDPTFHFHPEYQLFLVLKGRGTRFIGDNIKPFREGDLVFTGPNLPHVWRNDNRYFERKNKLNTAGVVIYFHDVFLGDLTGRKEEMESIRFLFKKTARGLEITGKTRTAISKMMLELLQLKGVESIIQLLKILNVIASSPDIHPITHSSYVPSNDKVETDRMNSVYEYVMKNFRQKVSLTEVAGLVNMTSTSFSRYFKSRVNKSFSDFLKEIRIHQACKLLQEEKISINQIAYECGFNTLSNFNKQFKELTGKTPFTYKNEYLKVKIDAYGNF